MPELDPTPFRKPCIVDTDLVILGSWAAGCMIQARPSELNIERNARGWGPRGEGVAYSLRGDETSALVGLRAALIILTHPRTPCSDQPEPVP